MLSSISPFVERGRGNRWGVVVAAHLIGGALGGASMGALWGLAGALTLGRIGEPVRLVLVGVLALVGLAFDARVAGLRLPNSHRQVPEAWRYEYRGWVYGVAYGALLGAGFATIIPCSATYVVFAAGALSASVPAAAALGAAFGLVRASALLRTRRVDGPEQLQALFTRLHRGAGRAVTATWLAQAALAVTAAVAAAGAQGAS